MDATEVSNADYDKFMKISGVEYPAYFHSEGYSEPNQPVVGVDWYDASFYCQVMGKRLPTYVEYLRASQGDAPRPYPFGEDFPALKKAPFVTHNYRPKGPVEVESFPEYQSPEGIYNLAGNVAEWTMDWVPESESSKKYVYGGSFLSDLSDVRVGSYVGVAPEENSLKWAGFRCARDGESNAVQASTAEDVEELKNIVYSGEAHKKQEMILAKKRQLAKKVREKEKVRDELKRSAYLKYVSLHELDRRVKFLTESVPLESEETGVPRQGWVGIPPGFFWMGADDVPNAAPIHMVYTKRFNIMDEPVRFQDFIESLENQVSQEQVDAWNTQRLAAGLDYAQVSYQTAFDYCDRRGLSLPTEAQLEKVIRGPLIVPELKMSEDNDSAVGYYGVKGVVYKVTEWTMDRFAPYSDSVQYSPVQTMGFFRVVRGQGNLGESYANPLRRRPSLDFFSHQFRCVEPVDGEEPDFVVNEQWNYLKKQDLAALNRRILEGENIFQVELISDKINQWAEEHYGSFSEELESRYKEAGVVPPELEDIEQPSLQ
jgi:formylglycine-generating enzyme required for sulfatase activity